MTEIITQQRPLIVSYLSDRMRAGSFRRVTRTLRTLNELNADEIPAASITNGPESIEPASGTMLAAIWRLQVTLYCYHLEDPQGAMDSLMAELTRLCANDHTLGGLVMNAQVTAKSTDNAIFAPFASGIVEVTIHYDFDSRAQGG